MKKIICDICERGEADAGIKVKIRKKYVDDFSFCEKWNKYKKIDICNECMTKILETVINQTMVLDTVEKLLER